MNKMGLVLQRGGARGAYEYGAVMWLVELPWQPVVVTGGLDWCHKCNGHCRCLGA